MNVFGKILYITKQSLSLQHQKRGVAQLASASAWGAEGRPFESDHPDKTLTNLFKINKSVGVFCLYRDTVRLNTGFYW